MCIRYTGEKAQSSVCFDGYSIVSSQYAECTGSIDQKVQLLICCVKISENLSEILSSPDLICNIFVVMNMYSFMYTFIKYQDIME